jgi:hypothetical protein
MSVVLTTAMRTGKKPVVLLTISILWLQIQLSLVTHEAGSFGISDIMASFSFSF